jgi:large subunit ribosomal protein L13
MDRKYHLFDAQGKILGRMATDIAKILSGRTKVDFTPHIDGGDFVVVINSDKIEVTGNKLLGKIYHRFSGYPGGISSIALRDLLKKDSTKVIQNAVYGMLPKNKLRNEMMKRLLVYKDAEHKHKIDVTH